MSSPSAAAAAAGDKRRHDDAADAVAASASGAERLTKQRSDGDGQHSAETGSVAASPAVRLLYKDSLQLVFTFGWAADQAAASRVCRLWASAVAGARQAEAARISRLLTSIRAGLMSDDLDELRSSVRDLHRLATSAGTHREPARLIAALNSLLEGPALGSTVARLISLLSHADDALVLDAAEIISRICLGAVVRDFAVVEQGALALLSHPKQAIRCDACVALARLCAIDPDQIERVINANLFAPLVAILKNDELEVQKEAAAALTNALGGGTDAQIRYLAHQAGVIPPLCELFTCPDEQLVLLAMTGIEDILRVGKADAAIDPPAHINPFADMVDESHGLDHLEALQEHENEAIYKKAVSILETYFIHEDPDGDEYAEPQDGAQFIFAQGPAQGGFQFGN